MQHKAKWMRDSLDRCPAGGGGTGPASVRFPCEAREAPKTGPSRRSGPAT